MSQQELPEWEFDLVEEAIALAEMRRDEEILLARKRAVQLAREQGYHRLAVAIDRPARRTVSASQLSFFPVEPTLFDEE
ncbi:MAG: hypothetical protein QOG54_1045 [Actinomycetota bacterium]|jgi:hypothetical protein|nr:hypothetical protein [Actinomycetota bacterium]